MSDLTDAATELEEMQNRAAIERQRREGEKLKAALGTAVGYCLNCEEPLDQGRFCDADCRVDFERRFTRR